jgi:hypothetical protein
MLRLGEWWSRPESEDHGIGWKWWSCEPTL